LCFHFFVSRHSLVGHGPLIGDSSRSYSDTPHLVELLWTSDQPDPETCTWKHTIPTREISVLLLDTKPRSQNCSGGIPTSSLYFIQVIYHAWCPGSNPGGDEIFLPSRPALGPTQPPVKWVPGLSRRGGKVRPGRAADHSPPSSAAVMEE